MIMTKVCGKYFVIAANVDSYDLAEDLTKAIRMLVQDASVEYCADTSSITNTIVEKLLEGVGSHL